METPFERPSALQLVWDVLSLPRRTVQRIKLIDFLSEASILGIGITIMVAASLLMIAGGAQQFGGLAHVLAQNPFFNEAVLKAIDETFKGPFGFFMALAGFGTILFGSFGFLRLTETVFSKDWGRMGVPALGTRLPTYWMLLCFAPPLVTLSVALSLPLFFTKLDGMPGMAMFVSKFFIQAASSFVAFTLTYKLIIGPGLSWRSAASGGYWAAIGFEGVKGIFMRLTFFHVEFAQSMGGMLIVQEMLVFSCAVLTACVFLFGNHMAYIDEYRFLFSMGYEEYKSSEPRPAREIALVGLVEITRRLLDKTADPRNRDLPLGLDALELAQLARTTPERAKQIMALLDGVGIVTIIQEKQREAAILKFLPEKLTLDEFLARLEQRVTPEKLNLPIRLDDPVNSWFWNEYSNALESRFGKLTLRDLAQKSFDMAAEKQKQEEAYQAQQPVKQIA